MATAADIMPLGVQVPSRRGFLGFFAAASVAATAGGLAIASAPAPMDWRSKPVERWTQADFIAEAEFELAGHTQKAKDVFRVGMTHHEDQLYRAHLQFKAWWELELMDRQEGL